MSIFTKIFKHDRSNNVSISPLDVSNINILAISPDLNLSIENLNQLRKSKYKASVEFGNLDSLLSEEQIKQNEIASLPVYRTYTKTVQAKPNLHYNKKIKPSLVKGISDDAIVVRTKSGKSLSLGQLKLLEREGKLNENFYISDEVYNQGLHANDVLIVNDEQFDPNKAYNFYASKNTLNRRNESTSRQWQNNRNADDAGRRTNDLLTAGLVMPATMAAPVAAAATFGIPVALATGLAAYAGNEAVNQGVQLFSGYDGEYGLNGYAGWSNMVYDNLPLAMKERMPITSEYVSEMSNPGLFAGIAGGRMYANGRAYAQNTAAMRYNETALPVRWNLSSNAQIVKPGESVQMIETTGPINGKSYYGGGPSNKAGMGRGGNYNRRPDVKHGANTNGSRKNNQQTTYTTTTAPYIEYSNPTPIMLMPDPLEQRQQVVLPDRTPAKPSIQYLPLPQSIIEETWKGGLALHDWYAALPSRSEPYIAHFPGGDGTPAGDYVISRVNPDIRVRRRGLVVGTNSDGYLYGYAVPDSTTYIIAPYTGLQYPSRSVQLIAKPTPGNTDKSQVLVYDK